jgi:hypothetical protein
MSPAAAIHDRLDVTGADPEAGSQFYVRDAIGPERADLDDLDFPSDGGRGVNGFKRERH